MKFQVRCEFVLVVFQFYIIIPKLSRPNSRKNSCRYLIDRKKPPLWYNDSDIESHLTQRLTALDFGFHWEFLCVFVQVVVHPSHSTLQWPRYLPCMLGITEPESYKMTPVTISTSGDTFETGYKLTAALVYL
jgi:hypothetical protein